MKNLKSQEKKIKNALIKKATGYDADEIMEEYSVNEDGIQHLSKRRVSKKHFAPDISAIKLFLSYWNEHSLNELEKMSDEELIEERNKLIKLLEEKTSKK